MQLFECQGCGAALHFDNDVCLTCGRRVGFLVDFFRMSALEGEPDFARRAGRRRQALQILRQ